ncbi:MAG: Hsp20/alpha crystallin family protein [Candidatus Nitrosotenuis sp.]|nr:Hsp20/alpha crystallin family protein [Candidatus Nitrosotenuis sp.]
MTGIKPKQKSTELVSWPFQWSNLDNVFDNLKREFEKSFASFPVTMPKMSSMTCDVADQGDRYEIKVDLPGVKKDEIKLNVSDNSLEISAQHKEEEEEKKKNYIRRERSQTSYYRAIPLPEKVLSDKTQAKLTDGILSVIIPKSVPVQKSKNATINVQ